MNSLSLLARSTMKIVYLCQCVFGIDGDVLVCAFGIRFSKVDQRYQLSGTFIVPFERDSCKTGLLSPMEGLYWYSMSNN